MPIDHVEQELHILQKSLSGESRHDVMLKLRKQDYATSCSSHHEKPAGINKRALMMPYACSGANNGTSLSLHHSPSCLMEGLVSYKCSPMLRQQGSLNGYLCFYSQHSSNSVRLINCVPG